MSDTHGPSVPQNCFIAPNSTIAGDVTIGQGSSIWFGTVLRAETNYIKIGENSNIQDNTTVHSDLFPVIIGSRVSVGHNAVVHGCTIEDDCLVGIHSTVLNGAVVGSGSVIAAGTLVLQNAKIPPGSLVIGVPGKVIRSGDEKLKKGNVQNAKVYETLRDTYKSKNIKIHSNL